MQALMLDPGAARLFQLVLGHPPLLPVAETATWLERLELALRTLNPRHALVARQRFLREPQPTLEQVGRLLGVSRERARQLEARAVEKLRHPSRRLFLEGCGELEALDRSGLKPAAGARRRQPAVRFASGSLRKRLLIDVRDVEMSERARVALARYGVRLIGDLARLTTRELGWMVGVGAKTRSEMLGLLSDLGLTLGMRVRGWAAMKAEKMWGCAPTSDGQNADGSRALDAVSSGESSGNEDGR
jgi:hypothetical protein